MYGRSRSRSPLSHSSSTHDQTQNSSHDNEFYMLNIPNSWKYTKVKTFIKDKVKPGNISELLRFVTVLADNSGLSKGACVVRFKDASSTKLAMKLLMGTDCEGKKVVVLKDAANILNHQLVGSNNQRPESRPQGNENPNTFEEKTYETYGLSVKFLASLDIRPPLVNKVFVCHLAFEVTEDKLREIFSLAGQVLSIILLKTNDGHSKGKAKIIFDHPVEAVQAISMFNLQQLYDREIIVKMDHYEQQNELSLPHGLKSIGPGLGQNGEPMRGIRMTLDFQPIKQMVMDEINKMKNLSNNTQSTEQNLNVHTPVQVDANAMINSGIHMAGQIHGVNSPGQVASLNMPQVAIGVNQANPLLQMLQGVSASNINTTLTALRNQAAGFAHNLNTNVPNLPQNVANLVQTVPGLTQNVSGLAQNVPGLAQNVPGLAQNVPGLAQNVPGLAQNLPGLAHHVPGLAHSVPGLAHNVPGLAQNMAMFAQNAALTQNMPGLAQNMSNLAQNAPNTQSHIEWKGLGQNARPEANVNRPQSQSLACAPSNHQQNYSGPYYNRDRQEDNRPTNTSREDDNKMKSSDMVILKNLPSSVNLQSLTNKMREVGELKFTEVTAEGRALVRFLNVHDAERCVKLFHRSKVDGQTIEVKFF